MTTSEIMATVQVAFNKFVKKVLKKSYNSTIDVQFGISSGFGVTEDFFNRMINVLKIGYLSEMFFKE